MALIDILFQPENSENDIVIVETQKDNDYETRASKLERQFRDVFGRQVKIESLTPEQAQELSTNGVYNFLIHLGSGPLPLLPDMIKSISLSRDLREKHPHSNRAVLIEGYEGGPVRLAIDKVLGMLLGDDYETDKENIEHLEHRKTVLGYLERRMASVIHEIGSGRDAKFKDWISGRYQDGNLQSTVDKTFLVVSNRPQNNSGKFDVVKQDADLSEIDFSNYLAVLVDNNDTDDSRTPRIGQGISVLEQIARLNPNLPIFYETAHPLEDFPDKEIERVEAFPKTTFISKNCAPKISRSRKVAKKEVEVGKLVAENIFLSRYCTHPVPIGEQGYVKSGKSFITLTKAAPVSLVRDPYKDKLFEASDLEDNPTNHKMYVLALFHTELKDQTENPDFQIVGKDFFDFAQISEAFEKSRGDLESRVFSLRDSYERTVEKHKQYEPRVLTHNDSKWDNWFNNQILGDYGSVCPGTEYKDIARALLNPSTDFQKTLDNDYVNNAINAYLALRKRIDPEFQSSATQEEFRENVYEMLFAESLRIARYKIESNPKLAKGLLKVAEHYS